MKKYLTILLVLVCLSSLASLISAEGPREVSFTHTIENGKIELRTRYQSNFEKWDLTENKDLVIEMEVVKKPSDAVLMIENMVAKAYIEGGEELDGKQLDVMDDKLHGDWQPGWYFDKEYKYDEIFLIQAVDENRLKGWGLMIYGWGHGSIKKYRLTEEHLKAHGVIGTEMSVVYNILIKYDNEEWWHTESLMDDFIVNRDATFVPVASQGVVEGIRYIHEIENGKVKIETYYYTDLNQSEMTDNKKLIIEARILEQPSNFTALIEHMHADASIFGLKGDVKGKKYSTYDDKVHYGDQPGFHINPQYHYREIYSIQGADEYNIEGWAILLKIWGYAKLESYRASEGNLKAKGGKGTDVSIAIDVAMKYSDEEYFHKKTITDDFIWLLNGTFIDNWGGQAEKPPPQYKTIMIYPNAWYALYPFIAFLISLVLTAVASNKNLKTLTMILGIITFVCFLATFVVFLWGSYSVKELIPPPTNQ